MLVSFCGLEIVGSHIIVLMSAEKPCSARRAAHKTVHDMANDIVGIS